MTRIRLPYIHRFLDRHGQARYYVRRAGRKRVALKGLPGSEEFMSAYQAALADLKPPEIGAKRTKPGTINATVIAYYASTSFTADFSASTRAMRRAILERFRVEHGDKRIALLHQDHVARLLDKMKPSAQRNWLKTLRGLMRFAVAQRLRGDDPTRGIELRRVARTGGHLTWGDSEIAKYRNAHDLGTVARVALELMLNVAARPGDACQLGRQHITKDGRLSWHPNKTRRSHLAISLPSGVGKLALKASSATITSSAISALTDFARPPVCASRKPAAPRQKSWPCQDIARSGKCRSTSRRQIANGWPKRLWTNSARLKRQQRVANLLTPSGKPSAKLLKMLMRTKSVATPAGFEPATFSLEGCCSIP